MHFFFVCLISHQANAVELLKKACPDVLYNIPQYKLDDLSLSVREVEDKYKLILSRFPSNHKDLEANQIEWVNKICNTCEFQQSKADLLADDQIDCISKKLEDRSRKLDFPEFLLPYSSVVEKLALKKLLDMNYEDLYNVTDNENRDLMDFYSCKMFEKYPEKAAHLFSDSFGSSMDQFSPICKDVSIEKYVPEMRELIDELESISGFSSECNGTIRFSFYRTEMLVNILAAVEPNPFKSSYKTLLWEEDYNDLGFVPDFHHWSIQGNWQKRKYSKIMSLRDNLIQKISEYYINKFDALGSEAYKAAAFHIDRIIKSHTGRTGRSSRYLSECFNLSDLDSFVYSGTLNRKKCSSSKPSEDLRKLLGLAIVNGYSEEIIDMLIKKGASLKRDDDLDDVLETPLMLAAPYPKLLKMLLENGANVNDENNFGKTALMYAIQENNAESVKLLLKYGADVNQTTVTEKTSSWCSSLKADGRTPLMYAAWHSSPQILEILLENDADIGRRDSEGETAIYYVPKNLNISEIERSKIYEILNYSY